ncbi:MAG: hypothetical protein KBS52_01375 [Clostridiales bacterium]|nr:hypothetical protein [Candidatus Equinaster intestinalis]
MKNTVKITFCGMMCALGVAIMLLAYFPYFTYAVPAIAGLLVLIVYIEIGLKWSAAVYIITSVLAFLFCESEAKLMYVFLLGFYPIIKIYIEKIKNRAVSYVLKFLTFNVCLFIVYLIFGKLFGTVFDINDSLGKFEIIGLILLGNFVFFLYDIVLVRAAAFYLDRLHGTITKIFK